MKTEEHCYHGHYEIRKETFLFLFLIILLISSLCFVYFYVKPKIERVYIVQFSDTFTVPTFNASIYNYTSAEYIEMQFNESDYGTYYNITEISIGFEKFMYEYNSTELLKAYLYHRSALYALNDDIEYGNYIIRRFDLNAENLYDFQLMELKFKINPAYCMFFVCIKVSGNYNGLLFEIPFYLFMNHDDSGFAQKTVTVYNPLFIEEIYITDYHDIDILQYPYGLFVTEYNEQYSPYTYDFSFR